MKGIFLLPYSVGTFLGLQIKNRHRMKKIRVFFACRIMGGNVLLRIFVLVYMHEGVAFYRVVRCVMLWCVALCGCLGVSGEQKV